MAIHARSTPAPTRPLLPFVHRPVPLSDDPRTADHLLEKIRDTITGQSGVGLPDDTPDLPPEPLLAATVPYGCAPFELDTLEAVRSDLEAPLADQGRGIHLKRALHEAFDFGFALLDALDLPPLALDVIDDGIAALDALDAPDEDREDSGDTEASLGWTAAGACSGYDFDDREHDTADAELSCGWTAKVDQVHLGQPQDEHETTALERHGRGFLRSGLDDAEDDDSDLEDDELGDDHAGDPVAWVFGPSRREGARV